MPRSPSQLALSSPAGDDTDGDRPSLTITTKHEEMITQRSIEIMRQESSKRMRSQSVGDGGGGGGGGGGGNSSGSGGGGGGGGAKAVEVDEVGRLFADIPQYSRATLSGGEP